MVLFCGSGPSGELTVLVGNSPRDCGPGGQWLGFIFIWWGIVLMGSCLEPYVTCINFFWSVDICLSVPQCTLASVILSVCLRRKSLASCKLAHANFVSADSRACCVYTYTRILPSHITGLPHSANVREPTSRVRRDSGSVCALCSREVMS